MTTCRKSCAVIAASRTRKRATKGSFKVKATWVTLLVFVAVLALLLIGCENGGNLPYQGDYTPGQGSGGSGGSGDSGGGGGSGGNGGTTPPAPPSGGGGSALQPPAPPILP